VAKREYEREESKCFISILFSIKNVFLLTPKKGEAKIKETRYQKAEKEFQAYVL